MRVPSYADLDARSGRDGRLALLLPPAPAAAGEAERAAPLARRLPRDDLESTRVAIQVRPSTPYAAAPMPTHAPRL